MRYTDIREVKKALRQEFKTIRRSFLPDDKGSRDGKILQKLTALPEYRESPLLLTYVSTAIEVDTHRLIEQAVSDGKRVAVPWCVPGKVEMKFFYVNALSELAPGTFGVLEPVPERAEELPLAAGMLLHSFCVLPGLGFDLEGYRPGVTAGVCYTACLKTQLPHGRYDRRADILVTEKFIKRFPASDDIR